MKSLIASSSKNKERHDKVFPFSFELTTSAYPVMDEEKMAESWRCVH